MGVLGLDHWRINPAYMAVAAAGNQVAALGAGMPKDHARNPREIELHHGVADRKAFEGGRGFRDDDRIESLRLIVVILMLGRRDDVARRLDRPRRRGLSSRSSALMILEPTLVAA